MIDNKAALAAYVAVTGCNDGRGCNGPLCDCRVFVSEVLRAGLRTEREAREKAEAEVARLVKSRNKWGKKYNDTLATLRLAVMTDSEYVKAVDEKAAEAIARAEAAEAALATARNRALREAAEVLREFKYGLVPGAYHGITTPLHAITYAIDVILALRTEEAK